MEQIFMFELFVKRTVLKVEPYVKDEWELAQEAEEARLEAERLAALEAMKKPKKNKKKKKPNKRKKGKKGRKKKEPPMPSEQELKFMQSCSLQINCLPVFEFLIAHDNFIEPPPPPPPPKKTKKKKKKPKPKKKGKKGKKKPMVRKIEVPSDPLPQPPFFGVGNSVAFVSRPSTLAKTLNETPLYISVWNRDENLNCVGFCKVNWDKSFFECLKRAEELNPVDMDKGEFRNTNKQELITNTVEYLKPLQCEEDLKSSGEIEFYIRLSCLGNKLLSHFISLPEIDRLPGRYYLNDDLNLKDLEVVRHWQETTIYQAPPVAYLFGVPDIVRKPITRHEEEVNVFEDFVAPFTKSELAILAMGFPKGPCGGTNCPKRLEFRGSQHTFIHGQYINGEYMHGNFINKRDVHGPCGRLDCPLAHKVRTYLCNEGAYKTCRKPCTKDYY